MAVDLVGGEAVAFDGEGALDGADAVLFAEVGVRLGEGHGQADPDVGRWC